MNIIEKFQKIKNNQILKMSFELLLVMVSIFVVSYAWFITSTKTTSKDITIKTKASRLLYISLDNGETWNTELSLDLNDNFKFNSEVTSNGINFYKALTKREDGTPITFIEATSGKDYLEFDILFKANVPLGVFLDSTSTIIPSAGVQEENLIGQGITRKSSYGNFSRDLIAGAVRIAFIDNDYIEEQYIPKLTPSLVWAPNKNYELIYNDGIYDFNINSNTQQDYTYINVQNNVTHDAVDNLKDQLNTDYTNEYANGDPMITKIDTKYNNGIKAVTVRIWIEGNDREAHTALTGGMFKLNLNFMGILKEENKLIPNVSTNTETMTINNYNELMEYTIDNGMNWIKYETNNNPTFNSKDKVLVRYSETSTYYSSKTIELNF